MTPPVWTRRTKNAFSPLLTLCQRLLSAVLLLIGLMRVWMLWLPDHYKCHTPWCQLHGACYIPGTHATVRFYQENWGVTVPWLYRVTLQEQEEWTEREVFFSSATPTIAEIRCTAGQVELIGETDVLSPLQNTETRTPWRMKLSVDTLRTELVKAPLFFARGQQEQSAVRNEAHDERARFLVWWPGLVLFLAWRLVPRS